MSKRILAAIVAALALFFGTSTVADAKPRPKAPVVKVVKRTAVRSAPTCASVVGKPAPVIGDRWTATYVTTRTSPDYSGRTDTRRWVNYRGPQVWLSTACGGTITTWVYQWDGTAPNWM